MKLSIDFGRWTTTKAALAVAGLLAIGGAVGSALAISPTVAPPIKWQGGWEKTLTHLGGGVHGFYDVPAGRNLQLTDLVVTNAATTLNFFGISVAPPGSSNCAQHTHRLQIVYVQPSSSIDISLQTGIGFTAGQKICVGVSTGPFHINARGFLFTPAPAG